MPTKLYTNLTSSIYIFKTPFLYIPFLTDMMIELLNIHVINYWLLLRNLHHLGQKS